jgi:hypothetical protein
MAAFKIASNRVFVFVVFALTCVRGVFSQPAVSQLPPGNTPPPQSAEQSSTSGVVVSTQPATGVASVSVRSLRAGSSGGVEPSMECQECTGDGCDDCDSCDSCDVGDGGDC